MGEKALRMARDFWAKREKKSDFSFFSALERFWLSWRSICRWSAVVNGVYAQLFPVIVRNVIVKRISFFIWISMLENKC